MAIERGEYAVATIRNLDAKDPNGPGSVMECMFRPKEYTFNKTNNWETKPVTGDDTPDVTFTGGDAMTLSMDLFFDTYEDNEDVRKHTNKIWKLMMVDENLKDKDNKARPPLCEFRWGETWSFQAVLTSLVQKFTLFHSDGRPARSTVTVSFKQALKEGKYPGQNPTTLSKPGYKTRRVKQGETLDWIAFDEYGDSSLWRFLADTNGLENPMKLEAGQLLAIAPNR